MLKRLLVRLLYASGLLAVYHRVRNRDALTVISLHRVVAENDPRWRTCDPLYTLSERLFEQCVRFFQAHYSIVSLDELIAARRDGRRLPPRPLLITFDDGWVDNYLYALPVMQRAKVPAAMFVTADAIDRHEAFFEEQLIAAWRRGALQADDVRALWQRTAHSAVPAEPASEAAIRALIAYLQAIPPVARRELLATYSDALADRERQMLTAEELRAISVAGVGVGTHGKAHEALTGVPDVDAELRGAKTMVAGALGVAPARVSTLSFPFSKQNEDVVQRARAAGYELLFGGGLSLTPLDGGLPDLLARVGVTAHEVTDGRGNLIAARLAAALFRTPHRLLEPA